MSWSPSKPHALRERAEECRSCAELMINPERTAGMLRCADEFERMAATEEKEQAERERKARAA